MVTNRIRTSGTIRHSNSIHSRFLPPELEVWGKNRWLDKTKGRKLVSA